MRPRGGIIGSSVTPTQSAAGGIWTLREAEAYSRATLWPALAGAPTSVAGTSGNAQVALTWTAPTATGGSAITNYTVQYSSNSGSSWTTFSRSASTAASATVTSLTNGTAYTFRVAAVTGYGTGAYSAVSSSVTPAAPSFSATAVLLTSGSSYTVPSGATSMKAWAVGGGGGSPNYANGSQAGGCAYKTWSVSGGAAVSYSAGQVPTNSGNGNDSTVTYGGVTITGVGGAQATAAKAGGYSGGDGGATGGVSVDNIGPTSQNAKGGAVGGNGASVASCGRQPASDVSGLFAALQLAGATTSETCGGTAAFGSGGYQGKFVNVTPGLCGGRGGWSGQDRGTGGAVVLYFT